MTQSYHLYDISVEQEGNSFQVYIANVPFPFIFTPDSTPVVLPAWRDTLHVDARLIVHHCMQVAK